jgi:hypothetical protein
MAENTIIATPVLWGFSIWQHLMNDGLSKENKADMMN